MNYQFLPQPDPDLEPVSPEVQARLLEKIYDYNVRRQARRRATAAVLFALALVGLFAYVHTHTMVQKTRVQLPPTAAKPPVAKPTPLPVPGPISDSSTTTQYVNDPVPTGTNAEPEEYNVIEPDGTTRFVSHKPYRHP